MSLSLKAFTIYLQILFGALCNYNLEKRVIEGYLNQPYSWFLNRNSAFLGTNVLAEVSLVTSNGIKPMMELLSKSIVAITILTLLVVVDPKLTLIIAVILSSAFFTVYMLGRSFVKFIGQERLKANQLRFNAVSETFGAVKEIKASGLEEVYVNKFSKPARKIAKFQASFGLINQLPRFVFEAIAFGGILLIALYLIVKSSNFLNAVPIISLYAFAGYRLMPMLQQIYNSANLLRFVGPSLNNLYKDVIKLEPVHSNEVNDKIKLAKNISLESINYKYPKSTRAILKDINFNIPANTSLGILGATGSGKTTIVDIILGLLEPQKVS